METRPKEQRTLVQSLRDYINAQDELIDLLDAAPPKFRTQVIRALISLKKAHAWGAKFDEDYVMGNNREMWGRLFQWLRMRREYIRYMAEAKKRYLEQQKKSFSTPASSQTSTPASSQTSTPASSQTSTPASSQTQSNLKISELNGNTLVDIELEKEIEYKKREIENEVTPKSWTLN